MQHRAGECLRHGRERRRPAPSAVPGVLADDDELGIDRAVVVERRDVLRQLRLRHDDALVLLDAVGAERGAIRIEARDAAGQRTDVEGRDGAGRDGRLAVVVAGRCRGGGASGRRRARRAAAGGDGEDDRQEQRGAEARARGSDHGCVPREMADHPPARRHDAWRGSNAQPDHRGHARDRRPGGGHRAAIRPSASSVRSTSAAVL